MNAVSLSNHTLADRDASTKAKTIAYWATTGLVVFCMTGGIFEMLGMQPTVAGIMRLGYPAYIIPALGLGKVLAILAILWPGLPRLKECAAFSMKFRSRSDAASRPSRKNAAMAAYRVGSCAG
jgi:hypothetical protein